MAAKQEFLIALLIGIAACVASDSCPPYREDIPSCSCRDSSGMLRLRCDRARKKTFEDVRDELLKNNLTKKHNIELTFSGMSEAGGLSSRIFEGFDIRDLVFWNCNVTRWADEEGGPGFVGLEDSLENLKIHWSATRPEKNPVEEHQQDKALMTLGHLHRLKYLLFYGGSILSFGNDWFGEGGNSVEEVRLYSCHVHFIGDRAFASLTNLKIIHIDSNPLRTISRSMFPNPAKNLEIFAVENNKLDFLPSDLFTNMPALNHVDLAGNGITHLPEILWKPIWSQLHFLKLSRNDLHCDDHINWMFGLRRPQFMFGECASPEHMKNKKLRKLIDEKKSE